MNLARYRRLLKALIAFSALMLLLGVGVLVFLNWYFSTESFKRDLTKAFQQATGYEISLEGDLGVTLFPWLGFKAENVRLYEPDRPDPLVEAARVSAGVRLIPLISGELDLDVVALEQVVVTVLRREDGSTGWDALVRTFFPSGETTEVQGGLDFQSVTVRGLQVRQGSLVYVDEVGGQRWEVSGLELRTGVYEPGQPLALSLGADISRPEEEVSGKVTVTGELAVDFETGHLRIDQGLVDAELAWPSLLRTSEPAQVTARVSLDTAKATLSLEGLHAKGAGLSLSGRAQVEDLFSEPVASGHLETGSFSPRTLFNAFAPGGIPDSDQGIFHSGKAALDFGYDGGDLRLYNLNVAMDDSRATGNLVLGADWRPKTFALAVDQLDFDRYYRLFITPEDFILGDFFPEFIRTWTAQGTVTAGSMELAGTHVEDLVIGLNCGRGDFVLTVDGARAYGGAAQGEYRAHVALGDPGYLVSMSGGLTLVGARAGTMPLGSGRDYALTGMGDLNLTFSMSEQPYALDRIIDDVLRHAKISADWVLRSGGIMTIAESEGVDGRQVLAWSEARLHLALTGNGRGGGHDPFGYQAGLALKMDGVQKLWNLTGKLSGPLSLSFDLGEFRLKGAEAGLQYRGPELPDNDPVALISAVLDLDSATGQGSLEEFSAEAAGLRLGGSLKGRDLFADNYGLDGKLSLASPDPKAVAAALYGVKAPRTEDPEVFRSLSGSADVLVAQDAIDLLNLRLSLDDTTLAGTMRLKDLGAGRMVFNLSGNGLDLDRYRLATPKGDDRPDPCDPEYRPTPEPLPLDTLRALDLEGNLALDYLVRNHFRMDGFKAVIKAGEGRVVLSPIHAGFYGGDLDGGLDIFVGTQALKASVDMEIRGFEVGPLLLDQFERDYVQGFSELKFHLKTAGATNQDLLEQLTGTAGFVIRNGSYKFLGSHKEAPQPEEQMGATITNPDGSDKVSSSRTSFDLALAEFQVDKGKFEVTDFKVSAPLLSGTGGGHFDVARNLIDLSINADFVAAPDVPIFIEGCLSDPDVRVPGDEVLQNAVEDIISIPLRPLQYLRDQLF